LSVLGFLYLIHQIHMIAVVRKPAVPKTFARNKDSGSSTTASRKSRTSSPDGYSTGMIVQLCSIELHAPANAYK
jgi:hypothetical protein